MLNKEQVDHLFAFCNKHYVQHYDLQIELVDHLANAVEEKMAIDSQLSFEEALNKVYTQDLVSEDLRISLKHVRTQQIAVAGNSGEEYFFPISLCQKLL
jgi:hypothetical protein